MRDKILAGLHHIEDQHDVRIAYACESGSRAWGFPSVDSDYDVRFVYLHSKEWYLSIDVERKRDVIEEPVEDALDLSGWDLRKALGLLRKGNPPLIEWLGSPIVYLEAYGVADQMRELLSRHHFPAASMYHYLHMARGNYRGYLKGPDVWLKKYLYVLRPLLAIRYLEKGLGPVPTEFAVLVDAVVDSLGLRRAIDALVEAKRRGTELGRAPRIEPISRYIEDELGRLEGARFGEEYGRSLGPIEEYNAVFRASLVTVWA
jgi:predicted nucleotidyltransferase